jgi:hypothetical protein
MDRRDFLKLMAQTGALAAMGGMGWNCGSSSPLTHRDPGSTVDYTPRNPDGSLSPYLVIPRLDVYSSTNPDPAWDWAGYTRTDFPYAAHGYWFQVPDVNASVDVVVPVINLGNMTTRHLVVEVYEGPHVGQMPLSQCELRDRKGPYTLHPGVITGFKLQYTRKHLEGASVAICYDPFFDPIHSIASVGALASDRKNLGNCDGLMPPGYPGYYGF